MLTWAWAWQVRVDSSLKSRWKVPQDKLDALRKDVVSEAQAQPEAEQPAKPDAAADKPEDGDKANKAEGEEKKPATNESGGLTSYLRARQALLRLCEEHVSDLSTNLSDFSAVTPAFAIRFVLIDLLTPMVTLKEI